ncbi:MAG: hypothetical protein ACREGA_04990 [Candidatus Saccharimonadales bacterium]
MNRLNITITSKNQITLPAEYVRKMRLGKNRRLSVCQRGNKLVLEPEPEIDIDEHFRKLWTQLPKIKGTKTDEELEQAIRDSVADAWDEKRQRGESD